MLTQSESELTAAEYTEVGDLYEIPAVSITAERYNLTFSQISDSGHGTGACAGVVSGSYMIRAYYVLATLYVYRSTDGVSWSNVLTIPTGVSNRVAPSLAAFGSTVRLFYYTSTDVVYRESTDNGATWGSDQIVCIRAYASEIAAVSLHKVHVLTFQSNYAQLHFWEYDDGSWNDTHSSIYWPHEPGGFDAIRILSDYSWLYYRGLSVTVDCGNHSSINDVPDGGAITVEAWIQATSVADFQQIVTKYGASAGWDFRINQTTGYLLAAIYYSGGTVTATTSTDITDGKWHHVAFTHDEGGDRKLRVFVDGALVVTSAGATSGSYQSDAAVDLGIGARVSGGIYPMLSGSCIGWCRISDSIRYSGSYTVPLRLTSPAPDANTVEQWNMAEGAGTTIAALLDSNNDGTISANGDWGNDKDLIVMSSCLQTRYDDVRQGIVGFFEANGRWSDHFDIDVVDESAEWQYRRGPRLTYNGGYYLLTFFSADGTDTTTIHDRCLSRSRDGRNWEKRTLLVANESGSAPLLVMGNKTYVINCGKVWRSDATRMVGYTPSSGDSVYYGELRADIIRTLSSEMGQMRQTNFILSDEDGTHEAGMFASTNTILLSVRLGYQSETYGDLVVPFSLEEVDFHRFASQISFRGIQVSSRDRMAWLSDKSRAADHCIEWLSQLLGRDRFRDETDTGYGGLRHTAGDGGNWQTEDEKLKLATSNETRQAHNTFSTGIGSGVIRSGVMFASDGNDELIGLTYHCKTVEGDAWKNYFRVCFEDGLDRIALRKVVDGVTGSVLAQSSTLGWSAGAQYYLMVEFRYKYTTVYYSTDNKNWTEAFTYVNVTTAPPEMVEGYVGYIGQGYSDEDSYGDDPWDDWLPGDPWPPMLYGIGHLLVGDGTNGVWYLPDGSGYWQERDGSLTGSDDDVIQLGWDPWWTTAEKAGTTDPNYSILWRCQEGAIYRSEDGGLTWDDTTPSTDPPNTWSDDPAPTAATVTYKQRIDSIHTNELHIFLVEWQNDSDEWRSWLLKTTDDGETWGWKAADEGGGSTYGIADASSAWLEEGAFSGSCSGGTTEQGISDIGIEPDGEKAVGTRAFLGDFDMRIQFGSPLSAGTVMELYGYAYANRVVYLQYWDGDSWETVYQYGVNSWGWYGDTMPASASLFRVFSHLANNVCMFMDAMRWRTGLPSEIRVIWADLDSEDSSRFWMTVCKDDVLYLQDRAVADMSLNAEYSLGNATFEQVAAKTYIAYPMTPHPDKDTCYVFGRMNAPAGLSGTQHIILTENGGTSWSSVISGWSDDYCAAFQAGQTIEGNRYLIAVRNQGGGLAELYAGDGSLAKTTNIGFEVNVDGLTVSQDGMVALGNKASGSMMVQRASYPYTTLEDITLDAPTSGTIESAVYL